MIKNKFKKFLMTILVAMSANATEITLKQGWNLVGTPVDMAVSSLGLQSGEIAWTYTGGNWKSYSSASSANEKISAGSGFWYKSATDGRSVSLANSNSTTIPTANAGWSLVSAISSNKITIPTAYPNAQYGWVFSGGNNGIWSLYSKNSTTGNYGYTSFDTVPVGGGAWIYTASANGSFGNTPITIANGSFGSITKNAIDGIDGAYNISFNLMNPNYNGTFDIGIVITKSSGGKAEILFEDITSNNQSISEQPVKIYCAYIRADGTIPGKFATTNKTLRDSKPISISNGVLLINTKLIIDYARSNYISDIDEKLGAIDTYTVEVVSDKIQPANYKTNQANVYFDGTTASSSTPKYIPANSYSFDGTMIIK